MTQKKKIINTELNKNSKLSLFHGGSQIRRSKIFPYLCSVHSLLAISPILTVSHWVVVNRLPQTNWTEDLRRFPHSSTVGLEHSLLAGIDCNEEPTWCDGGSVHYEGRKWMDSWLSWCPQAVLCWCMTASHNRKSTQTVATRIAPNLATDRLHTL